LAQPFALFERIWHEFSAHDGIVTFLAYVNGDAIAGAVHLMWNDTLYYKFGASRADALNLRPNDALFWAALRWASQHGYHQLDWGLSDLDQPGLVAFKQKWASEERRIVTLRSQSPNANGHQEARTVLAELTRLFTDDAVPEKVTEQAGALLYRYFT
jgi:CelD/BcsL family acetyltransferase involved in cellulose biosynthesis